MWKVTFKSLMGHKLRFALTALAVLLGVAFMAGTFVLTDTIKKIFNDLVANVNQNTDAFLRSRQKIDTQFGEQRGRVPASLVPEVRRVDGVTAAAGQLQFFAQLVGTDGEAVGGQGPPTFGMIWDTSPTLNPWTLVTYKGAKSAPPSTAGEIVIDKTTADKGKVRIGDEVTVLTQAAPAKYRVTGVATFGAADSPAGASVMTFTLADAERITGAQGEFDNISVAGATGISQEELVARIKREIADPKVEVITGAKLIKETQDAFQSALGFFNTALLVFAAIALFVGSFIIFNTFSIVVAQRTRELGLLRALGASGRQVRLSVLGEATTVGVVASIVGIGAGVLLSVGLRALLGAFGIDLPPGQTQILARTIVLSLAVGTGITVLSSLLPARRAARIAPIQALRTTGSERNLKLVRRAIIGGVVLAAGVGILLGGLFGSHDNGISFVGLGALIIFFGVAILGPVAARPVGRILGWPLPKLKGMTGVLARENAVRNPKRTASTASALMIGVALVAFITIFAASAKASINSAVDRTFRADFVIEPKGGGFSMGGFSPTLVEQVRKVDGVETAAGLRFAGMEVNGKGAFAAASDPETVKALFDLKAEEGDPADLTPNGIAVSRKVADDNGWKMGDLLDVRFPTTSTQLQIEMIYGAGQQQGLSDYFISTEAYDRFYTDRLDMQVYALLAPGADAQAVRQDIDRIAKGYPNANVEDRTEFKASRAAQINQILNLIYALLFLAILIALIGIANTLALSIYERTHELGLLRAVGMTRRQLRSSIRWEAVIIALFGTGLGIAVGLFFGWSVVRALKDQGFTDFAPPAVQLIIVVVLAAFAGVLAALWPARRAARLNVLDAIATE